MKWPTAAITVLIFPNVNAFITSPTPSNSIMGRSAKVQVVMNQHKPAFMTRQQSSLFATSNGDEEEEEEKVNPYADPNYPDLEFVNYDDPEYEVDQGDEYVAVSPDTTEEEIEAMREERRRR